MAVLNVNPTRMELSRLNARLKTSMRGHKLLKDKRDDMMKRFLALAKETLSLRREFEERIKDVYEGFIMAEAEMGTAGFGAALLLPQRRIEVQSEIISMMGVNVPQFGMASVKTSNLSFAAAATGGADRDNPNIPNAAHARLPYSFAFPSPELDDSIRALDDIMPMMLELAEKEKHVQLISAEIERTRRRVNALEHVQIPALRETIKSISMALDENERGNLARLMKVKDMMLANR